MHQLSRVSILLFYLLGAICLSFYVFFFRSGSQIVPSSIYLLFSILLLPLVSIGFDELELKNIFRNSISKREKLTLFWILFCGLFLYLVEFLSFFQIIVVLWWVISMRIWDGRIFFMGALLCLCTTILFLIFWENLKAELSSIYVYYLLVLGVLAEILLTFIVSKKDIAS